MLRLYLASFRLKNSRRGTLKHIARWKGCGSMATQKVDLNKMAKKIMKIAKEYGVEQNFFFLTVFKRYQVQINILNDLEKTIKAEGTLVTKEYVKGRKNVYTHPAITEYNKTSTAANQTVQTLMKIITTLRDNTAGDGENELLKFLQKR